MRIWENFEDWDEYENFLYETNLIKIYNTSHFSIFFILYRFMTSESWRRLFVSSSYIVMSDFIVTNTTDRT